jgi:hypothetical protein
MPSEEDLDIALRSRGVAVADDDRAAAPLAADASVGALSTSFRRLVPFAEADALPDARDDPVLVARMKSLIRLRRCGSSCCDVQDASHAHGVV